MSESVSEVMSEARTQARTRTRIRTNMFKVLTLFLFVSESMSEVPKMSEPGLGHKLLFVSADLCSKVPNWYHCFMIKF